MFIVYAWISVVKKNHYYYYLELFRDHLLLKLRSRIWGLKMSAYLFRTTWFLPRPIISGSVFPSPRNGRVAGKPWMVFCQTQHQGTHQLFLHWNLSFVVEIGWEENGYPLGVKEDTNRHFILETNLTNVYTYAFILYFGSSEAILLPLMPEWPLADCHYHSCWKS